MDKKWKIVSGIAAALSMGLLIMPEIFPACTMMVPTANGFSVPMCCHYTYQVELLVSIFALVVSGTLFFIRGAEGRRLGGLFLALLGVFVVLLPQPWVIGTCSSSGMACHKGLPWFYSFGVLLIMSGLVLAFLAARSAAAQDMEQEKGRLRYCGTSGTV